MRTTLETWRPVVGYEHSYEVSDIGRVRSVDRRLSDGRYWRGKVLRTEISANGYRRLWLSEDNRLAHRTVHSLVAEAFHGAGGTRQQVRHLDGDSLNNCVSNLRWGSDVDNKADRKRHGREYNSNKTRCPRGHLLVEPNLRASMLREGRRGCRACSQAGAKRPVSNPGFAAEADRRYRALMGGGRSVSVSK